MHDWNWQSLQFALRTFTLQPTATLARQPTFHCFWHRQRIVVASSGAHSALSLALSASLSLSLTLSLSLSLSLLSFLVQEGFLHRDLTSENVLLTAQEEPRIIDFGFAIRKAGAADGAVFRLRPAGNARWRAPEITMRLPYGRSVDVYRYVCSGCERLVRA